MILYMRSVTLNNVPTHNHQRMISGLPITHCASYKPSSANVPIYSKVARVHLSIAGIWRLFKQSFHYQGGDGGSNGRGNINTSRRLENTKGYLEYNLNKLIDVGKWASLNDKREEVHLGKWWESKFTSSRCYFLLTLYICSVFVDVIAFCLSFCWLNHFPTWSWCTLFFLV